MEKRRICNRAILLSAIWLILLVVSLSFLSVLLSIFASNPQGETVSSASWAGYIVSKDANPKILVNSINASWTVPTVAFSATEEHSSIWIGVGGQLESTLIQEGTEQDVIGGQQTYYAWYELLPNYSVKINTLAVSAGDIIVASLRLVDSSADRWNIAISDSTTGQYFGTTVVYNSSRSSGEWILEQQTVGDKLTVMANFTNASFTGCHLSADTKSGAIKAFYFSKVEMTNAVNTPLVSVSNLSADGTGFNAKYLRSK